MKSALIIGGSEYAFHEAFKALLLFKPDAVFAVNDAGILWPGLLDYWVTLHPEYLPKWQRQRMARKYPWGYRTVAPPLNELSPQHHRIDIDCRLSFHFPDLKDNGSSGLYAVRAAIDYGYKRNVLAGIPMQENAGHFVRGKAWAECEVYAPCWHKAKARLEPYVRSMSGMTRQLFGEPTREWLNE